MAKRMILMLAVTAVFVVALGFVKYRQINTAIAQFASFRPPPEAVTTVVARQDHWPSTLGAIGTVAAVRGVTVSADLPGVVEQITFESGKAVREGDLLVQLDTRQERAQLASAEAQRDLSRANLERMGERHLDAPPPIRTLPHKRRGVHAWRAHGVGAGPWSLLRGHDKRRVDLTVNKRNLPQLQGGSKC